MVDNIRNITDYIFIEKLSQRADAIFVVGSSLSKAAELAAEKTLTVAIKVK